MNIAIDFDGTLCEDKFPNIGKPKQEVINWVLEQQNKGCKLILYTLRREHLLVSAINWAKERGIVFDYIANNKIGADIFIDDKNMRVEDINRFDCNNFKRG